MSIAGMAKAVHEHRRRTVSPIDECAVKQLGDCAYAGHLDTARVGKNR